MTTVNHVATVQVPCPTCDGSGTYQKMTAPGSFAPAFCLTCKGTGLVDVWLVGPWDGIDGWRAGHQSNPPPDLVALTEPCDHGFQCGEDLDDDGGCLACYGDCPDCIDGHPAVKVVQMIKVHAGFYPEMASVMLTLGRGTISPEHILPVVGREGPTRQEGNFIADRQPAIVIRDKAIYIDEGDVSPGQYVALVIPEATP